MSTAAVLAIVIGVWALVVWAGIAWVHYLADDRGPLDKEGLIGVRGWLTLLVGGLVAWGPLIGIGRFYQDFSNAESQYPAIKRLAEWQSYTSVMWFLVLVLTVWQFHAGWRMCRERSPAAIEYLKRYLLISPLALLTLGLPNVLVLKSDYPAAEMFGSAIGLAIVNGIWLWYLSKSKRVARTYNLLTSDLDARGEVSQAAVLIDRAGNSSGPGMSTDQIPVSGSTDRAIVQRVTQPMSSGSSLDEKISQHRLERSLGNSVDDALYSKCLSDCEFDQLRATALYQRLKAGLDKP